MDEEEDVFEDDLDILNDIHKFANRPRLDSRMSVCLPTKGLFNGPGMNNCFLNACVQLLWHLNVFRRSFRLLEGHACTEHACIFCALKQLFYQFEESDALTLDPNALREAMANSFMYDHRFQLGRMDDAAECLENLLQRLHCHIAYSEEADTCTAPYCISHQKFACNILEQVSCRCKSSGEPKSYHQYVHYVTASALASSCISVRDGKLLSLGAMLKDLSQASEKRPCPDEKRCKYRENKEEMITTVQSTLLNAPDVVSVGIIWDTDRPNPKYINDVMSTVTEHLYLPDMFDNVIDDELKRLELKLAGVITYYGKHYTSFFYNVREKQWMHFDDARVDMIGSDWSNVTDKCYYNRYQPLLFCYTNGSGLTVNTDDAPKFVKKLSQERLITRTSQHRKVKRRRTTHRSKHRKVRSRSHSPSVDILSDEHPSSPSSNSSPSSPEKTKSPRHEHLNLESVPHKRSASHSPHRKLKSFDDAANYQNDVRNFYQNENSQPMKYSNSESSILDMKSANGDSLHFPPDFSDSDSQRSRSGSLKKRFESALKNINPYLSKQKNKYLKTKNENRSSLDEANFADVGFGANYLTNEKNGMVTEYHQEQQNGGRSKFYLDTSNANSSSRLPRDHSPSFQLDALQKHAENLTVSLSDIKINDAGLPSDTNPENNKSKTLPPVQHHLPYPPRDYVESDDERSDSLRPNHYSHKTQTSSNLNGYGDDLIYFNSRPEVFISNHVLPQRPSEFETLINKGDLLFLESQREEERGDIPLALRLSTEATAKFRDASKLSNISRDLVDYINMKRNESFQRSKFLQNKLNPIIMAANMSPTAAGDFNAMTKTSDYGSMSDPPSFGPNTPNWDSSSITSSSQRLDELVALQNHNAKQLAINRVSKNHNTAANGSVEYTGRTIYDDVSTVEKNNMKQQAIHDRPFQYAHSQQKHGLTDIRWVIDRPNNNYSSLNERLVLPNYNEDASSEKSHILHDTNNISDNTDKISSTTLPAPKKTSKETIYETSNSPAVALKKLVNNVAAKISEKVGSDTESFDTLQKLRLKKFKKNRCAQCGFCEVESVGQFCGNCQSEYL